MAKPIFKEKDTTQQVHLKVTVLQVDPTYPARSTPVKDAEVFITCPLEHKIRRTAAGKIPTTVGNGSVTVPLKLVAEDGDIRVCVEYQSPASPPLLLRGEKVVSAKIPSSDNDPGGKNDPYEVTFTLAPSPLPEL